MERDRERKPVTRRVKTRTSVMRWTNMITDAWSITSRGGREDGGEGRDVMVVVKEGRKWWERRGGRGGRGMHRGERERGGAEVREEGCKGEWEREEGRKWRKEGCKGERERVRRGLSSGKGWGSGGGWSERGWREGGREGSSERRRENEGKTEKIEREYKCWKKAQESEE